MRSVSIGRNKRRVSRRFGGAVLLWPLTISLLLGGALFGVVVGVQALTMSPQFQVKEIRWAGLQHFQEPEMARRFKWVIGRNLFQLNVGQIQERLLSDPWVKETVIRKDFPDRLVLIVTERTPASVLCGAPACETDPSHETALLDTEGVVLERTGPYPPGLPRLTHFNPAAYPKALSLAGALSDRHPFSIDLSNPEDLRVALREGSFHFGGGNFQERWRRFLEIESDLKRRGIDGREIDLRFSDKVIVKAGFSPRRGQDGSLHVSDSGRPSQAARPPAYDDLREQDGTLHVMVGGKNEHHKQERF